MKRPALLKIELVHIKGPLKGQIQEFQGPEIEIGRHSSCHLRFPPDLAIVSRKHAKIVREGNRFKLIDHSTNGTFINGKKVKQAYLRNGDVITFAEDGPKVSFLITKTARPQPAEPDRAGEEDTLYSEPLHDSMQTPLFQQGEIESDAGLVPPMVENVPASKRARVPLVIQYGIQIKSFQELPVTIGTDKSCDFVIGRSHGISSKAEVFYQGGDYWLKDLTGRGLTSVNNRPVKSPVRLLPQDVLDFGQEGPALQFLGEGRFAEAASLQSANSIEADREEMDRQEDVESHKKGSIFKKIFLTISSNKRYLMNSSTYISLLTSIVSKIS